MDRPSRDFPALRYETVSRLLRLAADQADGDIEPALSFAREYVDAKGNLLAAQSNRALGDLGAVRDLQLRQLALHPEFDVPATWGRSGSSVIPFIAALYGYAKEETELMAWLRITESDESINGYFGW